jgi:hypothetical protein
LALGSTGNFSWCHFQTWDTHFQSFSLFPSSSSFSVFRSISTLLMFSVSKDVNKYWCWFVFRSYPCVLFSLDPWYVLYRISDWSSSHTTLVSMKKTFGRVYSLFSSLFFRRCVLLVMSLWCTLTNPIA